MIDAIIGFTGVGFGLLVGPPQLWKIIKTGKSRDISLMTYVCLCLALCCYLFHAIYIRDAIFITAQSIGLVINSTILILMLRDGGR